MCPRNIYVSYYFENWSETYQQSISSLVLSEFTQWAKISNYHNLNKMTKIEKWFTGSFGNDKMIKIQKQKKSQCFLELTLYKKR